MNPVLFSKSLSEAAADFVSKLYSIPDLPRNRVQELLKSFTIFLQTDSITMLLNNMIQKCQNLGDSSDSITAYRGMVKNIQDPFELFNTEHQCLNYFEKMNTYIPPQEIIVGEKDVFKQNESSTALDKQNITIQFIPLRRVFEHIFELPNIFDDTIKYLSDLEENNVLIKNIVQGKSWKEKKATFGDKLVFPIFMYQDDYETNNPLGSHKGLGKMGAVYILIPCLPPHLSSKTENIFLLALYKSDDLKYLSLQTILAKAIKELQYLESTGITISTASGPTQIYFSLAAVIGDNLAVHSVLGFIGSFSAKFPCRFCKINRTNINSTFKESSSELRTEDNYKIDLEKNEPSETGIAGPSVFDTHLKTASVVDLMTVDVMHDILEGIGEYDLGLIMHHFITIEKYFTLENINNRIEGFYYGDEIRNKPRILKPNQIKTRFIKMSASEARCFIQNIGILIGDWIPSGNSHWRLVILLKEILDIVSASVIYAGLSDYLSNLIQQYLSLLTTLFPGTMKPKHHFMIHYPRVMELKGPLWNMNTMRPESRNRDSKITSNISLNRTNVAKTLAIKSQLVLNHRLRSKPVNDKIYESGKSTLKSVQNLQEYSLYASLLSFPISDKVAEFNSFIFRNKNIAKNVILMMPTESDRRFFKVHIIIEDNYKILRIITKDITDFTYYDEHFQAYKLHGSAIHSEAWKIFTLEELKYCVVSRVCFNGNGFQYIPKRWI